MASSDATSADAAVRTGGTAIDNADRSPTGRPHAMVLVTVEAAFSATDLERAIALFEDHADTVRAMTGCESYALYRAQGEVGIVQRWRSMEAFDAYRASPTFATLGRGLRPLMSAPPVTTVARVDG